MGILVCALTVAAQERPGPQAPAGFVAMDDKAAEALIAATEKTLPKFHAALVDARAHDPLIKLVVLGHMAGAGRGPAFAAPAGVIRIDAGYLETRRPNFDDNRMVVVFEHELGHLHYYQQTPREQWSPENSEKAAFEYSLKVTRAMAEKGDCGPLQSGLKFMKLRSESDNMADAHVRALKRMVQEPLYAEYVAWAAGHCAVKTEAP